MTKKKLIFSLSTIIENNLLTLVPLEELIETIKIQNKSGKKALTIELSNTGSNMASLSFLKSFGFDIREYEINLVKRGAHIRWDNSTELVVEESKPKQIEKPPLGLVPRKIVNRNRRIEILEAMRRYEESGHVIPIKWIREYEDIIESNLKLNTKMNREIKFRVWTGSEMEYKVMTGHLGNFYVHGLSESDSASMSALNTKYPDSVPIMQYTGLKDKNGKEIYEGDILKLGNTYSFIVWCLDRWRFNSYMESGSMDLYDNVNKLNGRECAIVVGNIYENPELLK